MAGAPSFLMEEQQHAMSISPTMGRLELIRRLVGEINTSIANLEAHINNEENSNASSSEPYLEPMAKEPATGASQEKDQALHCFCDDTRQLLTTLSMENLNSVRRRIFDETTSDMTSDMEMSPSAPPMEAMQTSPPATPMTAEQSPGPMHLEETAVCASSSTPKITPSATVTSCAASSSTAKSATASPVRQKAPPEIVITEATPPRRRNGYHQTTGNDDDEVRFVPLIFILQHFGEEWVPVFTRDQQTQENQEPYSDAYLSGMPARTRRRVRQNRPATSFQPLINETVRDVVTTSPAATITESQLAMRRALREQMLNISRARAANSEDYDPSQCATVEQLLSPSKSPNKDPENRK